MKVLTLILGLLTLCAIAPSASAKACFRSKVEMIHDANVIAVIVILDAKELTGKERAQGFRKTGQAKLETLIKGEIRESFAILGDEEFECASCPIVPGRYLAFLRRHGNDWAGCNWQLSLRPIQGDRVEWYKDDENHGDMASSDLKATLEQIRKEIHSRDETEDIPKNYDHEEAVCWKLEGRTIDDQGGYTAMVRLLNPTANPVVFRGWSERKPRYRLQTLKDGKWVEVDVDRAGDKDLRACVIAPGQSAVITVATRNELIPVRVGVAYSKEKDGSGAQFAWSDPIAK